MKYILIVFLLVGCGVSDRPSPEEQGEMIKRCHANGLDWSMGDWGKIFCVKKND